MIRHSSVHADNRETMTSRSMKMHIQIPEMIFVQNTNPSTSALNDAWRRGPIWMVLLATTALLGVSLAQAQVPINAFSYSRSSSFTYVPSGATKGMLQTETIEPDVANANLCVTTTYGYDPFGNKNSATTANCASASGLAVFTARTSTSNFGTDGQFPVSSTNAKSQSESKTYDKRFGALATLLGPNSLPTTITVDAFGRKTKELRSDGTSTVTAYCFVSGLPFNIDISSQSSVANTPPDPLACPAPAANEAPTDAFSFVYSESRDTTGAKMGSFVRVYSDRQGRQLRTITQSFDGTGQTAGYSLVLVAQDTFYNT